MAELATYVTQPPVRLIKTRRRSARPGRPFALEAVEAADLPSLRAGMAVGTAIQRAGDYYGHAVNLASRVTGVARAGSVLCTARRCATRRRTMDWSSAGKHTLKGMADPVPLYRARPGTPRRSAGRGGTKRPKADRPRRRAGS